MERRLTTTRFSKFGSLYYKNDLPDNSHSISPLYIDSTGKEMRSEAFDIGPTNHRSFFDFGRGVLDIDRGPCKFIPNHTSVSTTPPCFSIRIYSAPRGFSDARELHAYTLGTGRFKIFLN